MKKLFTLLSLFVLIGMSANVFAQGSQQTVTINSTRNYWVNSTDGTTQDDDHVDNSYTWAVYLWGGSDDYTAGGWDATATAATAGTNYNFVGSSSGTDVFATQINWLASGSYVVEVVESNGTTGCTTVRRFGITVIDLDLLVVTRDHLDATLTADGTYCNTDEGNIYGDDDADDLNSSTGVDPALGTMTFTYEITLYTVKGSTVEADQIGDALSSAGWKFTAVDASTIPTSGDVTWTVSGGSGTYSTGGSNVITVAPGTSTVTITAEIQNIAAAAEEDYELDFSIAPSSVLIENGGSSSTDYAEGEEPADYDGVTDTDSHLNSSYTITVNPIPNTTKVKFD
ncbi:hypothetical protein [uncultured Sunxiuqinia sp.]|uniref:hypothetical protein n=1 Tax=uncultured Sunxiuqinia sp. TaxID=1573825 RepID=UPI002AA95F7B|nr:hypothetical protein [uncultured Sunxiuqinia sp.]